MSSKNISISDNILCTVKKIQITVNDTGTPTGSGTASFQLDTNGQIQGIFVINAVNLTKTTVYPTGNPFLSYTQNGNIINITNVAGLPSGNNFQLTVLALG